MYVPVPVPCACRRRQIDRARHANVDALFDVCGKANGAELRGNCPTRRASRLELIAAIASLSSLNTQLLRTLPPIPSHSTLLLLYSTRRLSPRRFFRRQ